MNLCVDIGNTNSKAGLFQGQELLRYFEHFSEESLLEIEDSVKRVMVSRSGSDPIVEQALSARGWLNLLNYQTSMPIELNYKTPDTLGSDRIAAAVGARSIYPDQTVLIIDLGTCLTIDLLSSKGQFQGGLIAPGLEMRLKAMHEFTASLPLVDLDMNITFPGKSTAESMQVGVVQSVIYEIQGYVSAMSEQFESLIVVDCSGNPLDFEKAGNFKIFAHPKLVLQGLNVLANYNA